MIGKTPVSWSWREESNLQPTDYKSDRGRKAPICVVPEFEAENRVIRAFEIISKVYRNYGQKC